MKKAFTLIELMAVIAILGIVLLIIMPSVTGILSRSKTKLNNEQISSLENAARQWGTSNLYVENGKIYYDGSEKKYITIKELQNSGYLEDKTVKDLTDKSDVDTSTKICITYENNQYVYEYKGSC